MKFHLGLSLKVRILLTTLLPVASIVGYSAYAYHAQTQLAQMTHEILDTRIVMMQSAEQIKQSLVAYDDALFRYLETNDTASWHENRRLKATALGEIEHLQHLSPNPILSERLVVLEGEAVQYFADAERLLEFSQQSHTPLSQIRFKSATWVRQTKAEHLELAFLSDEGRGRLVHVFSLCDEIITVNRLELDMAEADMHELLKHSRITAFILSLTAIVLIILAAIAFAYSLMYPLHDLLEGVRKIERGELNVDIPVTSHDEMGELTTAFNRATRMIREQREALFRETITDSLTGLYNQRHFRKLMKQEMERAMRAHTPVSLLMIDIDHFKRANDTYGHEFGNEVLKSISRSVREALREIDLVARYGGDELSVILPNTSAAHAQILARRVLQSVGALQLMPKPNAAFERLTISIGGASFPDEATSLEDLIVRADGALYAAKESGRGRLHWTGSGTPLATL